MGYNERPSGHPVQEELARQVWTTPVSDDVSSRKKKYAQGGTALSTQAQGKLNPGWVSQLMGLEPGWTQLEGATDPHENRIDRLRLLGNGVVPQTAEKAFRTLLERLL